MSDIKAIRIKINVDKVDDAHLYPGKQGRYLNVALLPTPDSQYGDDFMVVQELDKAARDAGKKGPILGNARIVANTAKPKPDYVPPALQDNPPPPQTAPQAGEEHPGLPF